MSFSELLNKPIGDIKAPPHQPGGSYAAVVTGMKQDKTDKGTETIEYTVRLLEAKEDVDAAALAQVENWRNRDFTITFYLTEAAAPRLTEFLINHVGLDANVTLDSAINQVINQSVGVFFKEQLSKKDNTKTVSFIDSTFKLID